MYSLASFWLLAVYVMVLSSACEMSCTGAGGCSLSDVRGRHFEGRRFYIVIVWMLCVL